MTDEELRALFETMRQENADGHAETRRYVDTRITETQQYIDAKTTETQRHVDSKTQETRRHFDIAAEDMKGKFDLLADSIAGINDRLDGMDEKIERTAAETQAMFKFSHVELDRRVTRLEDTVSDLQSRVERLERSPH